MKQGSPEWLRAKYAAMLVAHLSLVEPDDSTPKDSEPKSDEKPIGSRGSDDRAS